MPRPLATQGVEAGCRRSLIDDVGNESSFFVCSFCFFETSYYSVLRDFFERGWFSKSSSSTRPSLRAIFSKYFSNLPAH